MTHESDEIINIFNSVFFKPYNTKLVLGEDEPIYLPADSQCDYHRVIFAHGYVSSALHEIAHWCVAGPERRLLPDYGYWYEPDGRTADQQAQFEQVELRPQAYEWILSVSARFEFRVSCDNLHGEVEPDHIAFKRKVHAEVLRVLARGLPKRLSMMSDALRCYYDVPPLGMADFRPPLDLETDKEY